VSAMINVFVWTRAVLLLGFVFLPPVLVLSSVTRARKSKQLLAFPLLIGIAAIGNWVVFLAYALTDAFHGAAFHFRISELAPALLTCTLLFVAFP